MDTQCWQLLGIEPTQDLDIIRQAYRQKVPQFHPETDPEGFKRLRQAYDTASRLAQTPPDENRAEEAAKPAEEDSELTPLQTAFDQLLSNPAQRCDPQHWQRYIHLLNQHSVDVIDRIRWPLLQRLSQEPGLANRCAQMLAERMRWQQRLDELADAPREEIRDFLDSLEQDDLFDFSLLSHLSLPAQLQTIFYFQQANGLFWNRPWFALKAHLCIATTIYWPDTPDLMRRLVRWHSHAEQPCAQLRDYCLQQMAEKPEDDDWLYLAARHCSLCDDQQQAFALWFRLYQRNRHPQAEQWILDWCAAHQDDLLPLLIQSLNHTPAPDLSGLPVEAPQQSFFISQHNTQMMARWGMALRQSLLPQAQDFILWRLGKQDISVIYRHLLQNHGGSAHQMLYWHACMLTLGDERLLQDILDQPQPEDPLHALILQGLQTQAAQRLSWLASSAIIQVFTQWLADPASPLPEAFTQEDSASWHQAQAWLRQFRALPPDSLRKLYDAGLPQQRIEPIKDCLADLLPDITLDLSLNEDNTSARDALRQAILLAVMLDDPLDDLITTARSTLPPPTSAHPAHSLFALFDGADAWQEDTATALKQRLTLSDPLHYRHWLKLPVSIEEYVDNTQSVSFLAADEFYRRNRRWRVTLAQSPAIYQLFFHAFYALLSAGEPAERHRHHLEQLEVNTELEEQIRHELLNGPSEALPKLLTQLSSDKRITETGCIINDLAKKDSNLPDTSEGDFLLEYVNYPHENITLRLIAKTLLQLAEQRESHFRTTAPAKASHVWQFWRLNSRINRVGYLLQAGLGSMIIHYASHGIPASIPYHHLIPLLLIVANVFIATRRRFNDMGHSAPQKGAIITMLLPILLLLPLIGPGSKGWNKFGPPQ
ncbi:J domain-containing protein [Brenneria sp. 4F2]|nr:J domain-containing protein [Brenneria bubanii]